MNNYQRLFKAIKGNYRFLVLSIVMILIVQAIGFVTPLLIKTILDDCLLGIESPWSCVAEADENTVLYQNKFYKQSSKLEDDDEVLSSASIVSHKVGFYFIEGTLPGDHREFEEDCVWVNGIRYEMTRLSAEEVIAFYTPFYPMLLKSLVLFLVLTLFSILCNFIMETSTNKARIYLPRNSRSRGMEAIERIPISYFERELAGKIATRIIDDINGDVRLYKQIITMFLPVVLSFILAYVGMFILNPKLALLSFLIYPLVILWVKVYLTRLKKVSERLNETRSLLNGKLNEIINGIQILQVFNFKKKTLDEFNVLNNEYRKDQMNDVKLGIFMGWNILRIISGIVTVIIVTFFGIQKLTVSGVVVTAGVIYAYNEYLLKLVNPIEIIFTQISEFGHAHVEMNRYYKFVEQPLEDDSKEIIPRYKGDVKFDNIWFSYIANEYVLKGVSFDIKAGSTVGLVGHTGSGKSSLMNLLLRFYDVTDPISGKIYVDGVDINTYSKRTYREHIGIVLQEPVMFKGTIASNIRFGKEGISDEQVEETLRSIGGGAIIDKFEQGINQPVARYGNNLSAGERQMIALARAIIYNPSILIMDEATSHIDVETEEMIKNALKIVGQGRTLIIIAHRISTIFNADDIIVLDHGLKIEEGTHESLMKENGKYASIYRAQLAGKE